MHASSDVNLVAVFGPEHGFRGTAQAGGSEGDSIDPRTGLPSTTCTASRGKPCRRSSTRTTCRPSCSTSRTWRAFYTYIWTMYDAMTAGRRKWAKVRRARSAQPDRRVRVNGRAARAPAGDRSGQGADRPAARMTVGELARLFAAEFVPDRCGAPLDLTVVR